MLYIAKTKEYQPFQLKEGQDKQILSPESIQKALQNDNCFIQTEVICENDVHEVNMELKCNK